jgi:hypothetical protein
MFRSGRRQRIAVIRNEAARVSVFRLNGLWKLFTRLCAVPVDNLGRDRTGKMRKACGNAPPFHSVCLDRTDTLTITHPEAIASSRPRSWLYFESRTSRDQVELALMRSGGHEVARGYVRYCGRRHGSVSLLQLLDRAITSSLTVFARVSSLTFIRPSGWPSWNKSCLDCRTSRGITVPRSLSATSLMRLGRGWRTRSFWLPVRPKIELEPVNDESCGRR